MKFYYDSDKNIGWGRYPQEIHSKTTQNNPTYETHKTMLDNTTNSELCAHGTYQSKFSSVEDHTDIIVIKHELLISSGCRPRYLKCRCSIIEVVVGTTYTDLLSQQLEVSGQLYQLSSVKSH